MFPEIDVTAYQFQTKFTGYTRTGEQSPVPYNGIFLHNTPDPDLRGILVDVLSADSELEVDAGLGHGEFWTIWQGAAFIDATETKEADHVALKTISEMGVAHIHTEDSHPFGNEDGAELLALIKQGGVFLVDGKKVVVEPQSPQDGLTAMERLDVEIKMGEKSYSVSALDQAEKVGNVFDIHDSRIDIEFLEPLPAPAM